MDFSPGRLHVQDHACVFFFQAWYEEYQNTRGMKLRNAESGVEPVDLPVKALDHDRSVNI